mgnify:CR=1 FL=1
MSDRTHDIMPNIRRIPDIRPGQILFFLFRPSTPDIKRPDNRSIPSWYTDREKKEVSEDGDGAVAGEGEEDEEPQGQHHAGGDGLHPVEQSS